MASALQFLMPNRRDCCDTGLTDGVTHKELMSGLGLRTVIFVAPQFSSVTHNFDARSYVDDPHETPISKIAFLSLHARAQQSTDTQ